MAHSAQFLLWMKLTHFVDRHLTTQMAAQRRISSLVSADVFCRVTVNLARLVWLTAVEETPAIISCLMVLHSTRSI
jgi:hypothetical protein